MALFALTSDGIQVPTQAQLVAYLTAQYQAIYGSDINLDSDTPDGQMMNVYIQMLLDAADLIVQVNNSFDPDAAFGKTLDQRVAINGIQRQEGTYTVTAVTIVTTQSINLYGLDQTVQPVFTVADNAGNQWLLMETTEGLPAGTNVFNFRAATPGAVLTVPNTITVPVTIVLGVSSINNPASYLSLGVNEEQDGPLKVRRQKSVTLSGQGWRDACQAALENVSGVSSAFVYENDTGSTDADGTQGHTMWAIVAGSGAASDIARAIYSKRSGGCGMRGNISFTITQRDGSPFVVFWDQVTAINLFIAFTVTSINGTASPNIAAILSGLAANYLPPVNGEVNINQLATLVQKYDANTLVTDAGFSNGQTQVATLSGTAASGAFKIGYNGALSAAINWNDSVSTIQSKVQAISGLSTATVSGSIASKTLTFTLPFDVQTLLTVSNNSLETSGAVAITVSWDEDYANVLLPPSKANQFSVSASNIIILPMQLNPSTNTVTRSTSAQLTGLGGQVPLAYAVTTNNSGGSINAATGLYTAGSTPNVTDTVTVTDLFGNTATATVNVV